MANTKYPIQEDENFVKEIENIKIIYVPFIIMGIVFIPLIIIISVSFTLCNIMPGPPLPYILYALGVLVFLLAVGGYFRFKQAKHDNYFITTKRLYVKSTQTDPHRPITKEDVKHIKRGFLSMAVILTGEIFTLHINKQNQQSIVDILQ